MGPKGDNPFGDLPLDEVIDLRPTAKEKLPPADIDLFHGFWWRAEQDKKRTSWGIYLDAIRKAKTFTLSDDMVEVICEMAFRGNPRNADTARRLNGYRVLARPPFPFTFIEFDYEPMRRWLEKHDMIAGHRYVFGKPERLGFLLDARQLSATPNLYGAKARDDVYRITTLGKMRDPINNKMLGAAMFPAVQTITYGNTGFSLLPNPAGARKDYIEAVVAANAYGVSNSVMWGLFDIMGSTDLGAIEEIQDNPLYKTGAIEPETIWRDYLTSKGMEFSQIMTRACEEQRFDLRFIVAALALLNHAPVKFVPFRPSGYLRPRFENRPFMTTNVITLEIPASRRRVKDINHQLKSISGGWHNRRHQVRGHWRVADTQISEKWERFYDPMTEKHRWRLWIDNHERGDASLGWVTSRYNVEAAPRASE